MGTLIQDVKFGVRMLVNSRAVTITAVITLGLGICAAATIFSWIDTTLLDPIPGVARTSDLVAVGKGDWNESPTPPLSYLDYRDLRDRTHSFSSLLAYHDDWVSMTGSARPVRLYAALVSANYFETLGVRPMLGRGFLPSEEGGQGSAPVAVIGYALWQTRFGGARNVIGKSIEVNRTALTIVGVTPRGFQGCKTGLRQDVWIPLVMDRAVWGSTRIERRDTDWLNLLGRLRPGATAGSAQQDLNVVMRQVAAQFPDAHQGPYALWLDPLWRSPFGANVYLARGLPLLLAMACVVLLLACANVANLLLVRAVGRRREIAIRLAMGASRGGLVRQMLVESLVLALAGGGFALILTSWTAETLSSFFPPTSHPLTINGRVDGSVLLATLLFSVITSLMSGILPALRASGVAPAVVLNDESGRGTGGARKARLASALVVVQVALSLLLLAAAGLFAQSVRNARHVDLGFAPDGVVLASIDLEPAGYTYPKRVEFVHRLVENLQAAPGVEGAAVADWVPLTFNKMTQEARLEGYEPRPHESLETRRAEVSPGYFRTMRIPILAGREFTPQDAEATQPVAIVNSEFARRYSPGRDVLGRRLRVGGTWFTIVGVARTTRHHRVNEEPEPIVYRAIFQDVPPGIVIHVRTSRDQKAAVAGIERVVHGLNPALPVFNVTTLRSAVQMASTFERMAGMLSGTFGLVALALAAVGIYGVLAYTTRQRTREIGIRLALGARRVEVFRLVVGRGLRLTGAGVAAGLVLSFIFTRALRGMLVGVGETDPTTFVLVTLLLTLVSLAACAIPGLRAAAVQPMVALRRE